MIFYRISRAHFKAPAAAFSGLGATKFAHRWNWARADLRAVYCSDSLALACLECLVHIRPLPRVFPASVYYAVDVPDSMLERPATAALPVGWDDPVPQSSSRDFGTTFLEARRAAGLVIPTVVQAEGLNVILNPLHPGFRLAWVSGPFPYQYDSRLA